jgi:GNAT superfamily N-acetyltransferase
MGIKIEQADEQRDASKVRELYWEYLEWANAHLEQEFGVSFDIKTMLEQDMLGLHKFLPPTGRLLLGYSDGQLAGIACMRDLGEGIGEIKRMYVRPAFRRHGLGGALVSRLIEEAGQAGYGRIRLDSARFMIDAHRLYRSLGFQEIAPYAGSEIPKEFQVHWIFMERVLKRQ